MEWGGVGFFFEWLCVLCVAEAALVGLFRATECLVGCGGVWCGGCGVVGVWCGVLW